MADKVLHGEGKPRIILTEAEIHSDTVDSVDDLIITLTSGGFDEDVVGRQLWSENASDEDTWGKIVDYDINLGTLTVDFWTNSVPVTTKAVSVKNKIIDLPYCQSLIVTFIIDSYPQKRLYNTGEKINSIKGFYYLVELNYARYSAKGTIDFNTGCLYKRKDKFI